MCDIPETRKTNGLVESDELFSRLKLFFSRRAFAVCDCVAARVHAITKFPRELQITSELLSNGNIQTTRSRHLFIKTKETKRGREMPGNAMDYRAAAY